MGLFDIFKQKNWLQVPLDENHNTWDARHSFLLNYSETTSNEDDSQVLSIYQEMIQFFKERKYSSELQDKYSSLQFLWHRPDHYKMRNLIKSKNPKLYFNMSDID